MSINAFWDYTSDLYFNAFIILKAFAGKEGIETFVSHLISILKSDSKEVALKEVAVYAIKSIIDALDLETIDDCGIPKIFFEQNLSEKNVNSFQS